MSGEAMAGTITNGTRINTYAPDGTRLAVYEWGQPAGPEVLLIHGFAQCHLCFEPQIRALAATCRVVAYDQRGHGASDQPTDPAAYQGGRVWADDIAAVIDAKQLKRPVIAGWSMGGRVTRQYLMVHGDSRLAGINFVASQVVEDPSGRRHPRRGPIPSRWPRRSTWRSPSSTAATAASRRRPNSAAPSRTT
jgi:pimeloyl-ACP methyl ester carboxylesterase